MTTGRSATASGCSLSASGRSASASGHGFTVTVYEDDLDRAHVSPTPRGWVTSLANVLADLHAQAKEELLAGRH